MREIIINPCDVIPLGHVGETGALQIQFDVTGWEEEYGSGVYELVVLRPGETTPYIDVVTASGNYVLWDVSNVDTAIAGAGTCQLNYYVGSAIAKSQVHKTLTSAIVGASAAPPDPYSTWLTNLQGIAADALADAQAAAQSATDAANSADDAEDEAENAADSATLSESWAIGGTGTRTGEDTNNAKYYSEQIGQEVEQAAASATLSESWAVGGTGTRAGEDANNSKYYSEQSDNAKGIAEGARDASLGYMLDSSAWATGQISGQDVPSTNPSYHNNSKYYSEQAASSATAADGSAEDAEAYAVGKRDGVDVTSGDPAYQNNSKYYASEAANSAAAAAASAATLVLDPTLTEATQAAQAKATGDAIAEVNSAIDVIEPATIIYLNIWDGTVFNGVRTQASGTQLAYSAYHSALYRTAKVKVTPGKSYTIVQSGSEYFVALTSSQNLDQSYIETNTPVSPANCNALVVASGTTPLYTNFTADANADYLYICYTLTNADVTMEVYEGTYTDFQPPQTTFYTKAQTYSKAEVYGKSETYSKAEVYNKSEVDAFITPLESDVSDLKDAVFVEANIWDGTVFNGVRTQSSGTQLAYSAYHSALYRTAKVKIQPNTAYTIVRADSSYLVALTSSQNLDQNYIETNTPVSPANTTVIATEGSATPTYFNFLSDANAEYLYICYTLTGESSRLEVYKGTYTDFIQSGTAFYTKAETDQLLEGEDAVSLSSGTITIINGKMRYKVMHITNATINVDMWRVYSAEIKTPGGGYEYVWNGQDADGVVQLYGEDDFIGGFHGDEIDTDFQLYIDGVLHTETSISSMPYKEIVIYQESNVYHCNTSATPNVIAFKKKKVLVFNEEGYTTKNYWVAQEALQVKFAYFGMLTVFDLCADGNTALDNGLYGNDDYTLQDADYTTPSATADLTDVHYLTKYGDISMHAKNMTQGNYRGFVKHTSSGDARSKTYMGPIHTSTYVDLANGGVLKGEATIQAR